MGRFNLDLAKSKIGVIGAGRFGRAFIQGVLKSNPKLAKNIWASARSELNQKSALSLGVHVVGDFQNELKDTSLLLLSVKPAQIPDVLERISKSEFSEDSLLISVAAGTSISKMEEWLKRKFPLVRAMPNSPCAIQEGVTAICRGTHSKSRHLEMVHYLFKNLGQCLEIEEHYFDLVTALSGSGPAYFYLFMEIMIEAGVRAGLSREKCVAIVAQTAKGAACMVQEFKKSPSELKKDVATPGGCTIEALKILDRENIPKHFSGAIEEAARVAGQLSSR